MTEASVPQSELLKKTPVRLVIMGKRAAGKSFGSNHLVESWSGKAWTVAERIKQISHALIDGNGPLDGLLDVVILDSALRYEATRQLLSYADSYEGEPGLKPIRLYQDVGEILRRLDTSTLYCWEEDLERRISANPAPLTVVDIRAKESHHFFVGERGYASLLISAPDEVRNRRMLQRDEHVISDPAAVQHVSETDVDELSFEFTIDNRDDDPTRLFGELDRIVRLLAERERAVKAARPSSTGTSRTTD
jgi:hypothetical protein